MPHVFKSIFRWMGETLISFKPVPRFLLFIQICGCAKKLVSPILLSRKVKTSVMSFRRCFSSSLTESRLKMMSGAAWDSGAGSLPNLHYNGKHSGEPEYRKRIVCNNRPSISGAAPQRKARDAEEPMPHRFFSVRGHFYAPFSYSL